MRSPVKKPVGASASVGSTGRPGPLSRPVADGASLPYLGFDVATQAAEAVVAVGPEFDGGERHEASELFAQGGT